MSFVTSVTIAVILWPALGVLAWLAVNLRWGFGPDVRQDFAILPDFLFLGPLSINIVIRQWK